jgi:hypothetical protein
VGVHECCSVTMCFICTDLPMLPPVAADHYCSCLSKHACIVWLITYITSRSIAAVHSSVLEVFTHVLLHDFWVHERHNVTKAGIKVNDHIYLILCIQHMYNYQHLPALFAYTHMHYHIILRDS